MSHTNPHHAASCTIHGFGGPAICNCAVAEVGRLRAQVAALTAARDALATRMAAAHAELRELLPEVVRVGAVCDGCAANIAVDMNGNHYMGPGGLQRCQRGKYAPAAAPVACQICDMALPCKTHPAAAPAACGKCERCGGADDLCEDFGSTPCALPAGHDAGEHPTPCRAVR